MEDAATLPTLSTKSVTKTRRIYVKAATRNGERVATVTVEEGRNKSDKKASEARLLFPEDTESINQNVLMC